MLPITLDRLSARTQVGGAHQGLPRRYAGPAMHLTHRGHASVGHRGRPDLQRRLRYVPPRDAMRFHSGRPSWCRPRHRQHLSGVRAPGGTTRRSTPCPASSTSASTCRAGELSTAVETSDRGQRASRTATADRSIDSCAATMHSTFGSNTARATCERARDAGALGSLSLNCGEQGVVRFPGLRPVSLRRPADQQTSPVWTVRGWPCLWSVWWSAQTSGRPRTQRGWAFSCLVCVIALDPRQTGR